MAKKYDVAVLGWWYGLNYGSVLTYYSLHRAISELGHNVLMVHEPLGYNGWRVKWGDDIMSLEFARRMGYNFTEQAHFSELPALNAEAGTFLVGSDQLWNPHIGRVNDDLFLDFVSHENKRISYATSFGNKGVEKFKPPFVKKHKANLGEFSAISVREAYAVDTAKQVFNVEATKVLDPVFLLPEEHYSELAATSSYQPEGKYLLIFILDPEEAKRDVILSVAKKLKVDKVIVAPNPDKGRTNAEEIFHDDIFEFVPEDGPENFLQAYKHASYVVTDSFHGTAFSVIFQKPFSSIYNRKRGADRFVNLLGDLGFGGSRRLLLTDTDETVADNPNIDFGIDFSMANAHLHQERERSLAWLDEAIKTPKAIDTVSTFMPVFETNAPVAIAIENRPTGTTATVADGESTKGRHVWFELPRQLRPGKIYRLHFRWSLQSDSPNVNVHLRNPKSGAFRVIGSVKSSDDPTTKGDTVDFLVKDPSSTQIMLGALHLTGGTRQVTLKNVTIQEISASEANIELPLTPEEKLERLADADRELFAQNYGKRMVSHSEGNARALLMFHSHSLEKGLSRHDFRPGFGKVAIPGLSREMKKWLANGGDVNDSFFQIGLSVMHTYFARHKELGIDVSHWWNAIDPPIQEMIEAADDSNGGVLAANLERETAGVVQSKDFIDVVFNRRSVREFTDQPVDDGIVEKAIQIAAQAPSVCNRQPARVHSFLDDELMTRALKLQGGWHGYNNPPKLLLITSELSAYLFADERNQAYIDGGLFMMNLLLAFENLGLGACSLNTAMSADFAARVRKILAIPTSQVFISFVAVGHYDKEVLVPRSKRLSVDDILTNH